VAKHSETTLPSICVTCPHRGSPSEYSRADQQPGWQHFVAARAGEQIATRNQVSTDVFVLCAGWAYRYFQLSDGRRQILKFLLPGDLFSSVTIFEKAFHFSVKALTGVQLSGFARCEIRAKYAADPGVQAAIANS
jgi:CRP-like cAMP-binding protein